MVYLFLAEGFETIEALTVVDMLRRAKIDVETVSITDSKEVVSAHKIPVIADRIIDEIKANAADCLVLPGGIPGTPNLRANDALMDMVKKQDAEGKFLAAICAAPALILCDLGITIGKKSTVYPSFNDEIVAKGVNLVAEPAVTDGHIITGQGMGTAVQFSAEIITALKSKDVADQVVESICFK